MGNLAFELSPGMVFSNALKRTLNNWKQGFRPARAIEQPLMFKSITQMDLLGSTGFVVKDACGVFNCRGQPGWAVAVTGLADLRVVFCREEPKREHALLEKLEEEDVVLIFDA
jgi:hypothetical protein